MNANATKDRKHRISIASICANAKYDDDKMNPFMSDRSEYEWFVIPEIPSYAWLPQSSTYLAQGENYTGPLISFVIRIHRHIRITYKWNLSFSVNY